jgi:hypothetical protein
VVVGDGKQRWAAVESGVERRGACMRRKGNGSGSPLVTPTRRDNALAHMGRRQ